MVAVSRDNGRVTGCAKNELEINLDLTGRFHYGISANQDENGTFFPIVIDDYMWANSCLWTNSWVWTNGLGEAAGIDHWVNQKKSVRDQVWKTADLTPALRDRHHKKARHVGRGHTSKNS